MTREVLEKKLKIAGIPDYIYNLTGQGKFRISGRFII